MAIKRSRSRAREASEVGLRAKALAREVWFAGLGVVAKTQVEPAQRIVALIERGRALRVRGLKALRQAVGRVFARPEFKAFARQARAWRREADVRADRLERALKSPMQRVLSSLGLPTRRELDTLARHIDALARSVDAISGARPKRRAARAAR